MIDKKLTILIPAYNPTDDLIPLTNSLIDNGFQVLVVNDGSKKSAENIFTQLNQNVILIKHDCNMGKGQALKTGFKYIMDNINCDGVITVDADGQHLVEDIISVANELLENINNNCIILGSRLDTSKMPLRSKLGNNITRFVFKTITHVKVLDTQTGLRAIPFSYLNEFLNIAGQRFEYETNMLIYCTQNNIEIKEVKINTVYLEHNSASNFSIFKDSYNIYKCLLKDSSLLTPIFYSLSSVIAFIIDFTLVLLLNYLLSPQLNPHISLLASVIIARIISSLINFTINKKIVFKSNKNLLASLVEYYLLVIAVLAVNYTLLDFLTIFLALPLAISKLFIEGILFVCNYLVQRFFIFKPKKSSTINKSN